MAQLLTPTSDVATGSWTNPPLWSKANADDGSDAVSEAVGNNTQTSSADLKLATGSDPQAGTQTLRARWHHDQNNRSMQATCELYQGDPAAGGSLIATLQSASNVDTTEVEDSTTVTGITDYTDLYVRLYGFSNGGGPSRSLHVDLVELSIPDAGSVVEQVSGSLAITTSLSGTPSVPTASVPSVGGGLNVPVALAGTVSVPIATVEQVSGSKIVSVSLAGTSSVPTPSVPQVGGDEAVVLSLTGTPLVPVASIPQISGSKAVSVILAGSVALPSTTPEVGGTKAVSITTAGAVQVPVASVPEAGGSFAVDTFFTGTVNVPTASVPQISGGASVSIVLAGSIALPGEEVVDPFPALRQAQVNYQGIW